MSDVRDQTTETPAPQAAKVLESGEQPLPNGPVERLVGGVRIEVPPEFKAAVQRAITAAKRPLPPEMTTTQAADFLDVSRPFLLKRIKRGELPCRLVGKHRRIPTPALLKYREKMYQRAKVAADEITRISQELGLYEREGPPPKER